MAEGFGRLTTVKEAFHNCLLDRDKANHLIFLHPKILIKIPFKLFSLMDAMPKRF